LKPLELEYSGAIILSFPQRFAAASLKRDDMLYLASKQAGVFRSVLLRPH